MDRKKDWFNQALDDFEWAEFTLKAAKYAQACFIAQQCSEKAVKALALSKGVDEVKGHSILEIVRLLGVNGELEKFSKRLDQYYISTRYPDAFAKGSPYEYFSNEQAEEAISMAKSILEFVKNELDN